MNLRITGQVAAHKTGDLAAPTPVHWLHSVCQNTLQVLLVIERFGRSTIPHQVWVAVREHDDVASGQRDGRALLQANPSLSGRYQVIHNHVSGIRPDPAGQRAGSWRPKTP